MKTIIIDYFDVLRKDRIDTIKRIFSDTKLDIDGKNNIKILLLDDTCHFNMYGRYPIWDEDHRLRVLSKELMLERSELMSIVKAGDIERWRNKLKKMESL